MLVYLHYNDSMILWLPLSCALYLYISGNVVFVLGHKNILRVTVDFIRGGFYRDLSGVSSLL